MEFKLVNEALDIITVEHLAKTIWNDYYHSIVSQPQIDYMLTTMQSVEAIREQIKNGFLYYLLIDDQGKLTGYFSVLAKGDALFLSKLYIKSRGRGYGKQTMNFIISLAREQKCQSINLTVYKENYSSICFYKKMGFMVMGSKVMDIGQGFIMDDLILEKKLD